METSPKQVQHKLYVPSHVSAQSTHKLLTNDVDKIHFIHQLLIKRTIRAILSIFTLPTGHVKKDKVGKFRIGIGHTKTFGSAAPQTL